MTEMKLGTYAGGTAGMTAFSAMSTPLKEPASTMYMPYQTNERMASAVTVGRGYKSVSMYWQALTRAQRDQLRTFCTGASASVYCYIPTNDTNQTFATFQGTMVWALNERWRQNILQDLTIEIINLVTP